MIGVNIGKLGFLAEFDLNGIDELAKDLTENNFEIEERMILHAACTSPKREEMKAINDIVIDKGRWPKMIQMTINLQLLSLMMRMTIPSLSETMKLIHRI